VLKYVEWDGPLFHCHYESTAPCRVNGLLVKSRVIVWPPKSGVTDGTALSRYIDTFWRRLSERYDEILREAIPIIERQILAYCEPDDEYTPPTAAELMRTWTFTMVKIDATFSPRNNHVLQFYDEADLIGSHDILIGLDSGLVPISAQMDG
jgi:hypothetical protein